MKISDYTFKRLPPELVDFKDEVTLIINYGKYAFQVIDFLPNWSAQEGEALMYAAGTARRFYVYMSGAWNWVEWGNGSLRAVYIEDSDGDTQVHTERNADEDVIRFKNKGVDSLTVDSNGDVYIQQNKRLALNGTGKSCYMTYNTSNSYMTLYVSNNKRIEF